MGLDKKELCGYEFIEIAKAYRCETGITATHIGNKFQWHIALDINEKWLNAEQSVYLIYEDEKLIYVGYYSISFQDRWRLRKKKYIWHSDNIDNNIKKSLENKKDIKIWLSINPYVKSNKGKNINISKYLEDEIIIEYLSNVNYEHWNTTGINAKEDKKNTKTVMEILNINE